MPRPAVVFIVVIVIILGVVVIMSSQSKDQEPSGPQAQVPGSEVVSTDQPAEPTRATPAPPAPTPADEQPAQPQVPSTPPAARPDPGTPVLTSLLGKPLYALQDKDKVEEYEANLQAARAEVAKDPDDQEMLVWVGRWLGYLWRMNESIGVYTQGIKKQPDYAPMYRHRGHRYLSVRQFDKAIADLEMAASLVQSQGDVVEEDGIPNARDIPLTTTAYNTWYHLGLARYLKGDYDGAQAAYIEALKYAQDYDDNVVATCDWLHLTYQRAGLSEQANAILMVISDNMDIIENQAYLTRVQVYKGELSPEDALGGDLSPVDRATIGYGVGCWYLNQGEKDQAIAAFEQVIASEHWPAFGFIAAEVELARLKGS